ncbi:hypothetical protein AAKU67_001632 [Oxalobacteraceae bacterium GrIS 2.11]
MHRPGQSFFANLSQSLPLTEVRQYLQQCHSSEFSSQKLLICDDVASPPVALKIQSKSAILAMRISFQKPLTKYTKTVIFSSRRSSDHTPVTLVCPRNLSAQISRQDAQSLQ